MILLGIPKMPLQPPFALPNKHSLVAVAIATVIIKYPFAKYWFRVAVSLFTQGMKRSITQKCIEQGFCVSRKIITWFIDTRQPLIAVIRRLFLQEQMFPVCDR